LVAKRAKDIDAARETADLYLSARGELARASDLRRAAEEFRKECEQAKEEAGKLLSCTKADRQLAQDELKTATEKRRQVDELRSSAEINHLEVEKLLKEAEEDRRQAAELRGSAIAMQRDVVILQEKANEDRRQAATLLSAAAEEKQRILEELPEEAKQDRKKAQAFLAECKALWDRTATEMETASVAWQQEEESRRRAEAARGQEVAQQLPIDAAGEQSRNAVQPGNAHDEDEESDESMMAHIDAVMRRVNAERQQLGREPTLRNEVQQPIPPVPPAPEVIYLDEDPDLEEIARETYRTQVELPMLPEQNGVRHLRIAEFEPNGPFLDMNVVDPARTAPHGTLPPSPTPCIACTDHIATCVVIPCGHMVVCGPCASELQKTTKRCPACMTGAYDKKAKLLVVRVYN
jgi:Zinc finger, C3HC4 type (RING finger)